jgi:hypothetical protein
LVDLRDRTRDLVIGPESKKQRFPGFWFRNSLKKKQELWGRKEEVEDVKEKSF